MARPSPSCALDDDRLPLPAASPSRSNSAEKKESTDPRLSQLCPPYVTPSSSSSLEYHRSDARIVENGFAAGSGMSNSAKVGLDARSSFLHRLGRARDIRAMAQEAQCDAGHANDASVDTASRSSRQYRSDH